MLSVQENERLTRVGPGTPMGELMRRYWHPVAATVELKENPTRAVRILGEDLVLYRDRSGTLGLLQESCPHRRVNLLYGIPEQHGLRCPYHGWLYNEAGQCLEMPAEAPDSTFKERIKVTAYPVQELAGLVFAYLGPAPAPLLPRWGPLAWENVARDIAITELPCNWLQCQENSLDPVHFEWLHGYYGRYMREREQGDVEQQVTDWAAGTGAWNRQFSKRHLRIGFDRFAHGIIKRRVTEGIDEEHEDWRIGHPIGFPNFVRVGAGWDHSIQWRVPIDDENTLHVRYMCHLPKPGEELTEEQLNVVSSETIPIFDGQGKYILELVPHQDHMVWIAQGPITDRTKEALNSIDVGVIFFRKMLDEQMAVVADGGDPINTFRDAAENQCIVLPQEDSFFPGDDRPGGPFADQRPGPPEVDVRLA